MTHKALSEQERKKELKEILNWMSSTENEQPAEPTAWKLRASVHWSVQLETKWRRTRSADKTDTIDNEASVHWEETKTIQQEKI